MEGNELMTTRNVLRAAALCSIGASIAALVNARLVPAVLLAAAGVLLVAWAGKSPANPR